MPLPSLGGLNTGIYFHSVLEAEVQARGWQSWFLLQHLSLACERTSPCCVLTWPLIPPRWGLLFQEGHQSCWTRAPPSWPHLNLINSSSTPTSKYGYTLRSWGVWLHPMTLGVYTSAGSSARPPRFPGENLRSREVELVAKIPIAGICRTREDLDSSCPPPPAFVSCPFQV